MQIRIDLKIFLFLIIFFLTKQIDIYILFMIFATIHEFGHLLIGIFLRFKPKGIRINPFGLSICFSVNYSEYSKKIKNIRSINLKKMFIAMAGPITNFLIAIFFIFFDMDLFSCLREKIIYSNLIIGLFNLIPIYPLDGGRIIKSLVHKKKNLIDAYKYTNTISYVSLIILTAISSIVILYLKNIAILFIIIYLWIIFMRENKLYNRKMQLYKLMKNIQTDEELFEYKSKT